MKAAVLIITFVTLLTLSARPNVASAQCGDAPKLTIQSGRITVSGEAVHITGKLPQLSDQWYYSVSCDSSRLFNFSLWTIIRYNDRDGYFLAKSWNLQIFDAQESPEKNVIFERENEFSFWGDVVKTPVGERIKIDSIVGLPKGIHGDGILRKVPRESNRDHR
jgi:hypothetical protein